MARPLSTTLTIQQLRTARVIAGFKRQGRPAFVTDLVKTLKLAGESSLTPTLEKMERNGFITIQGGKVSGRSRLIELTTKGKHCLGIGGLPLLGTIPAGPLSEAIAQPEEIIDLEKIFPHQQDSFLLRVKGDSMIGDGILDGDLVILQANVEVPNKAIAAVAVGEEAEGTLKRVIYEKENIRLRASNPIYKDILCSAKEVRFYGLLKGVIRNVGHK